MLRPTLTAFALLLTLALGAGAQEPGPDAAERALRLAQEGDLEQAGKLLRARLASAADDDRARLLLAQVLAFDGRADDAGEALEAVGDSPDRRALLLTAAQLRRQQAEDGPGVVRRRGAVRFQPTKDPAAEQAWKRARLELARKDLSRALELEPDDPDAVIALAQVQSALGDAAAAVATLTAQRERRATAPLLLELASALQALGREDESLAVFEQALALDPRSPAAHEALARRCEKQGQTEQVAAHRRRARFHAWVPAFLGVDWDEASYRDMVLLAADAEAAAEAELELSPKARSAAVEALIAREGATAAGLLAALCYHHTDHGGLEDRAFEGLSGRADAAPALRALFEQGESACTKKGALHALARLKDPACFELLCQVLPADVAPTWNLDAAGAAVTLGDARVVPLLIRILDPQRRAAEPAEGQDFMQVMQAGGRDRARVRAALALGHLPPEGSREALAAGLANPLLALACRASLYRHTREAAHLAALREALAGGGAELHEVARDLESLDDPELREALAAWRKRVEEARREGR